MLTPDKPTYWTPVDKFILSVVEEYDSLAMICPRIQSPYDLVRYDELNNAYKKYEFCKNLKKFYLDFLEKNNLAHDPKSEDFVKLTDISIMNHAPIVGHWMKESGVIGEAEMNNDHEKNFKEYLEFFDKKKSSVPPRRPLFPNFEGLHVSDLKYCKVYDQSEDAFKQNQIYSYIIYALVEKSSFNPSNGKFDKYSDDNIHQFTFSGADEINLCPGAEDSKKIAYKYEDKFPLSIFGDRSYNIKTPDEGFFTTDIQTAYHMRFNLRASYRLSDYDITPENYSDYSDYLDDIEKTWRFGNDMSSVKKICGRLLERKDVISDDPDLSPEELDSDIKDILQLAEGQQERISCMEVGERDLLPDGKAIRLENWKKLPVIKSDDIINIVEPESCVYPSYYDYYIYDEKLSQITNKQKANYFWFMYGALPINGLYYENLKIGLETCSYLDHSFFTNPAIKQGERSEIFEHNKIPLEAEKDGYLLSYKQTIKFLALVYGLDNDKIKKMRDIPFYYIPVSSVSKIGIVENRYEVLDSIYPKITSSKYEKTKILEAPPVNVTAPKSFQEKAELMQIILKIERIADLEDKDVHLLNRLGLLTDESKDIWQKMEYKIDNGNEDQKRSLMKSIRDTKEALVKFSALEASPQNKLITPSEDLRLIDEKIEFRAKDAVMTVADLSVLRDVATYITSTNPREYVSKDMIAYVLSWQLLENNSAFVAAITDPTQLPPHFEKGEKPKDSSVTNYYYLKINTAPQVYKDFVKELSDIQINDPAKEQEFLKKRAIEVPGKDRNVKPTSGGGDRGNKNPPNVPQKPGAKPSGGGGGNSGGGGGGNSGGGGGGNSGGGGGGGGGNSGGGGGKGGKRGKRGKNPKAN